MSRASEDSPNKRVSTRENGHGKCKRAPPSAAGLQTTEGMFSWRDSLISGCRVYGVRDYERAMCRNIHKAELL